MKQIDAILFDWDGTLVDSAQMAFYAMKNALGNLGILLERGAYERVFSPNWYRMYEAFGLERDKWRAADELWLKHYGKGSPCLVPAAYSTVWQLSHRGYDLGIVSSGSSIRVKHELKKFGIDEAFRVVLCNEDTQNKKPHPEALEMAMVRIDKKRHACSYVGDCPEDVEMGKRARVLTAGVRSKYPSSRNLRSAGPDLYLESIEELLDYFRGPGSDFKGQKSKV